MAVVGRVIYMSEKTLTSLQLTLRKFLQRGRGDVLRIATAYLSTPGFDAVNATLVAVPIILLYEFGLILAWVAEGGHRAVARKVTAGVRWRS